MAAVTGAKSLAEGKSPLRSMSGPGFAGIKEKVKGIGGGGGKGAGDSNGAGEIISDLPARI